MNRTSTRIAYRAERSTALPPQADAVEHQEVVRAGSSQVPLDQLAKIAAIRASPAHKMEILSSGGYSYVPPLTLFYLRCVERAATGLQVRHYFFFFFFFFFAILFNYHILCVLFVSATLILQSYVHEISVVVTYVQTLRSLRFSFSLSYSRPLFPSLACCHAAA